MPVCAEAFGPLALREAPRKRTGFTGVTRLCICPMRQLRGVGNCQRRDGGHSDSHGQSHLDPALAAPGEQGLPWPRVTVHDRKLAVIMTGLKMSYA